MRGRSSSDQLCRVPKFHVLFDPEDTLLMACPSSEPVLSFMCILYRVITEHCLTQGYL